ncbi:MAG: DUF4442 domain-containing protein [Sphingomonadales bacterium]
MENQFLRVANHRIWFRLYMLIKLPAAFLSGLRVENASLEQSVVRISLHWLSQNPFRSIYFASLAMAAEMSTGILAMARIYKKKTGVSMLVVSMQSQFYKKATGTIRFSCNDGALFESAIQKAIDSGESVTLQATASGTNQRGERVAQFVFTWSFKRK